MPNFQYEFLGIRFAVAFVFLMANYCKSKEKPFLWNQILLTTISFISAAGITYMIARSGNSSSIYFCGLNLVAIFSLIFVTLDARFFYLILALIYLPYYLIMIFCQFNAPVNVKEILIFSFFNIGTIAIILFNRKVRKINLAALIGAQLDLQKEIISREAVILQKTIEATKLNQLSAQFSPQVVEAIKSGKINLEESVKRSKICAIFIDIVNSTERVVRLDQEKVQISLARFLDTVLEIFLKYDLTIDKFHGDGVLAFANSPVTRQDFIERTCMAAIQARDALHNDRDFYILNWKSEMQVRVGISVGFANVGFYGGKKYFRTFSAIGAPLPFASRLTSIAQPGQILIDSDIADCLSGQNFITKNVGERTLKGFDGDTNIIFELVDQAKENVSGKNKKCPSHPDSILYLDTNDKGHFVFKCRECGFSEADGETSYFAKKAG